MGTEDKIVGITGVTSGVGRATAIEFARQGSYVVGLGRRGDLGAALAEEIQAAGGHMTFVTGDVCKVDDCKRFISTALEEHGQLDVLINNAGTVSDRPIVDSDQATEAWWDEILDTNLKGAFFCCRYALGSMKAARSGHIINIASANGVVPLARMQAYNVSKAALIHLSAGLAVEYQEYGVRVNAIVLGGVVDGEAGVATRRGIAEYLTGAPATGTHPSPTAKTSQQVGSFLAAMCGHDFEILTGATIAVDGAVSVGLLTNKYWILSHTPGNPASRQS